MNLKLFSFLLVPTQVEGTAHRDVQGRARHLPFFHRKRSRIALWNIGSPAGEQQEIGLKRHTG